jgi:prophage regulatory protein
MARRPPDRLKRSALVEAPSPLPEVQLANDADRARPTEGDQRSGARPATARFLRFPAVRARTGLSRSTIWRLEQQGLFPRRRRISHRAVAWAADEVENWTQATTASTDASCDQR